MGLASTRRVSTSSTRPSGNRRWLLTSYSMRHPNVGGAMKHVLVAAVVASAVAAAQSRPGVLHSRHVFVTVLDRSGTPVLDRQTRRAGPRRTGSTSTLPV